MNYTKKDLHDSDNHDGVITHLEPDILECKVKWALGSITMNKASSRGDGIPTELFQILNDAVKVQHSICQQIWKTQQWPQDWKRSVFIPILKKGNAKECSNYRTMALISVQFSRSVTSDSLRSHKPQHARPPCPSPTPGVHSDSQANYKNPNEKKLKNNEVRITQNSHYLKLFAANILVSSQKSLLTNIHVNMHI